MTDRMRKVLSLYRRAPLSTRVFLRGRTFLSDLCFVEKHVPTAGEIVDLGCGHGLFSNLLALGHPQRHVTGIDLDPAKIDIARETVGTRTNVTFLCGDITQLDLPRCQAISIIDVMYLLPPGAQRAVLQACASILSPGGTLVWKAQEKRPRWKYVWTYGQELLATSIGLTQGRRGKLHFLAREEAEAALASAGFEPTTVEMRSWRPYSDILYLARRYD